jgi:hypothetical protein
MLKRSNYPSQEITGGRGATTPKRAERSPGVPSEAASRGARRRQASTSTRRPVLYPPELWAGASGGYGGSTVDQAAVSNQLRKSSHTPRQFLASLALVGSRGLPGHRAARSRSSRLGSTPSLSAKSIFIVFPQYFARNQRDSPSLNQCCRWRRPFTDSLSSPVRRAGPGRCPARRARASGPQTGCDTVGVATAKKSIDTSVQAGRVRNVRDVCDAGVATSGGGVSLEPSPSVNDCTPHVSR